MVEDKATEEWKERAKKLGLIVNMGADKPKAKVGGKAGKLTMKSGKKDNKK
jgi:hypothetical protein